MQLTITPRHAPFVILRSLRFLAVFPQVAHAVLRFIYFPVYVLETLTPPDYPLRH